MNRVADEYRLGKAKAIIAIGERGGIDLAGGEADADGEGHGAVGDAAAEGRGAGEFFIHVMREEIAAVAGVNHDVGFGDGAAGGVRVGADDVIFEILELWSCLLPPGGSSGMRLPPIPAVNLGWPIEARSLICFGSRRSPTRSMNGTDMAAMASPC